MRNASVHEIRQVVDASDAWVLGTLAMGAIQTAEVLDEGADGGTFDDFPAYRWDVVKTTVYLVDMAEFAAMNEVYAQHFPGDSPARRTIAAAGLPRGARVAIEAFALGRDL